MTLRDLAKAVVMASANDATIALAEYVSGSSEEFTKRMNARAAELGMNDTFFADCGGFTAETVSTARDVAIMTAALFKHDVFGKYFKTRLDAVREGTEREAQLVNTNKMAHWYEGILGGKAGHSKDAGLCLSNCAQRGNMRLVAVVLGAKDEDDRVNLSEFLLDAGFRDFEFFVPDLNEADFTPVKVLRGVSRIVEAAPHTPVRFTAPRGTGSNARFEYVLPESLTAPVEKGQVIGTLTVRLNDKIVAESEIAALYAVDELTFRKSLEILNRKFFNSS
jgi:D-alanyl-D-alanine carboxypeptidase (penicillin-binding protein 5/6)